MERKYKIYISSIVLLMLIAITILFILFNLAGLAIVSITLLIVVVVYIVNLCVQDVSTKNSYQADLNYVLKTYKNILVKSLDLINLSNKNIIRTDNIEDLVNAQVEVRKPIYYKTYFDCTTFVLLDGNEALVYVIKKDDKVNDPTEFFTDDSIIDLNEITDSKVIEFRNKKISIEVIDNKQDLIDEEDFEEMLSDFDSNDEEFKKINKKRKKGNKKER